MEKEITNCKCPFCAKIVTAKTIKENKCEHCGQRLSLDYVQGFQDGLGYARKVLNSIN